MKVGIYCPDPIQGVSLSLAQALRGAGHPVRVFNGAAHRKSEVDRRLEMVFSFGGRMAYRDVIADYTKAFIPTFVIDLAPVGRQSGYFQIGEMGVNGLVEGPVEDRIGLSKLIRPLKPGYDVEGPVLLLGQKPEDAQHFLSSAQLTKYHQEVADSIHSFLPELEVYWRPHPKGLLVEAPVGSKPCPDGLDEKRISDVINRLRPRAVMTYNSTGLFEAICSRTPAFANDSAFYSALTTSDISLIEEPESSLPSERDLLAFMARMSWLIWKEEEFSSPVFLQHLEARREAILSRLIGPKEQRQAETEAAILRDMTALAQKRKLRRGTLKSRVVR